MSPKKRAFIAAYAITCSVSAAAELALTDRQRHYEWLKTDPDYKKAFEDVKDQAGQQLEDEAVRRAYHGVQKPVTVAGKKEFVTEYSDTLLIFLLKGIRPEKYRERITAEHTGANGSALTLTVRSVLQPIEEEVKA